MSFIQTLSFCHALLSNQYAVVAPKKCKNYDWKTAGKPASSTQACLTSFMSIIPLI